MQKKTAGWFRRVRKPFRYGALAVAALTGVVVGATHSQAATKAAASVAGLPPAPTNASAVPYSSGRAYVSWQPGPGAESATYQVETYLLGSNGAQAQGGQPVVGTNTVVSGLVAGDTYQFAVNAVNPAGSGPAATTNGIVATGAAAPGAPTGVALNASNSDNEVTVSWHPSAYVPAAESYNIGVFEGSGVTLTQVGAVTCVAPCTTETLDADPGATVSVNVAAANPAGKSAPVWSNQVKVAQPCPLACLSVATGSPSSAAARQSDGYLVPVSPSAQSSALTAVAPTQWRTNYASLSATTPAALGDLHGAAITDIVSDDWIRSHNVGGYAVTPWSNWTAYSQWVTSDVQQIEALAHQDGVSIKYWDVQNEPFGGYYYSNSAQPPASETVANFEQQFLVAYTAIKTADPNALVIGPSLIAWSDDPTNPLNVLDMRTFLDFCVANGIQIGGVSFHDNNFGALPGWYAPDNNPAAQPAEVTTEVTELRALIAARPSLGQPAILVNEYGDPYTYPLPGWSVGRMAALDAAGVTGANRSCWGNCDGASLDGLFTTGGLAPLPDYWVYEFYAAMTGQTVPVSTSFTGVTGLAAVDGSGTVRVLVGRHQSCTTAISVYCPTLASGQVAVRVQVPQAASARVTVAAIPLGATTTTPLTALTSTTYTQNVSGGWITVTTPVLLDGDAAEITVTPVR